MAFGSPVILRLLPLLLLAPLAPDGIAPLMPRMPLAPQQDGNTSSELEPLMNPLEINMLMFCLSRGSPNLVPSWDYALPKTGPKTTYVTPLPELPT
jgi:hypothetical protein